MGHPVLDNRLKDDVRLNFSQADVGATDGTDAPREAPAVAVEHRQGPQVDRALRHAPGHDIPQRIQVGTAVVINDSLRIAGGSRGVVQRNSLPFILRAMPGVFRIAGLQKIFVFHLTQPRALAREFRIVNVDDQGACFGGGKRFCDHRGKLAVGKKNFCLGVFQHERNAGGVEPGVDGMQNGPAHRHAVMRLQHGGHVRRHHRDGVSHTDPPGLQGGSQSAAASIHLRVGDLAGTVDTRRPLWIDAGCPGKETERSQGNVVCRPGFQPGIIMTTVRRVLSHYFLRETKTWTFGFPLYSQDRALGPAWTPGGPLEICRSAEPGIN